MAYNEENLAKMPCQPSDLCKDQFSSSPLTTSSWGACDSPIQLSFSVGEKKKWKARKDAGTGNWGSKKNAPLGGSKAMR